MTTRQYGRFMAALSVTLAIPLTYACKKKQATRPAQAAVNAETPIANAFAAKSAVAIHAEPDDRSKALVSLPIGQKVEIFASKVQDKRQGEKAYWYKVKYAPAAAGPIAGPVEGFVAEREEMLRDNFIVFEKRTEYVSTKETSPGKYEDVKEPHAVMAMASLNLRKSPALNGEVIRILKNGEVLSVLEESSKKIVVKERSGSWYRLKDEKGEEGYAFGGFLLAGGALSIKELADVGYQFASGWVMPLDKTTRIHANATGPEFLKINDDNAGQFAHSWQDAKGFLPAGEYTKVDGYTTKGKQLRYRIISRMMIEPDYYETKYFFVDKKKVRYHKDYFSISKELPHTLDLELAKEVNTFVGGDLNLQCTKVTEISAGGDANARRFMAIDTSRGAPAVQGEENCYSTEHSLVFTELGGDQRAFYKSPTLGELKDLDGDQVPELISQFHGRGSWSIAVYAIQPNKVSEILRVGGDADGGDTFEYGSIGEDGVLHLSDPYTCRQDDAESIARCKASIAKAKEVKVLKFDSKFKPLPFYGKLVKGRFVQVAAPKES